VRDYKEYRIDVSKNTLDVSMSSCSKIRTGSFANFPDGWRHLSARYLLQA